MVSIYDYTNYRQFLRDKFVELKGADSRFSYRFFNRLAGLQSSGFIKLVIDGKKNLALRGIQSIARGLKQPEPEQRFFQDLVFFNQSKTHREKDYYFKKLIQSRPFQKTKTVTAAQYHLFSNWYYVAILELVRVQTPEIKNEEWLRENLKPAIGLKKIQTAVQELLKLDLIQQATNGSLLRHEAMLTTPEEVSSVAITNFHVQMSQRAAQAVRSEPGGRREFSSLTILASEEAFQKAKQEIRLFRQRLNQILETEGGDKKKVLQINLQMFPLNKERGNP